MRPAFIKGTMLRDLYEVSVRIEKVKREFARAFPFGLAFDRGAPMQRRKEEGTT